ncbi:MAG: dihydrolipoyl dehydrogenase family protein [Candidatus Rokuibacteriota bacterium]
MRSFDLVVLGAGTAGASAAKAGAALKARTALVEEDGFAGMCLRAGCIPKKVLVNTVELLWRARAAKGLGLSGASRLGLDWAAVIDRKDAIVDRWSKGKQRRLERRGITVLRGAARFVAPHEIEVGGRRVRAKKIVIATGSVPHKPEIDGVELAVTSDEFLDRRELPQRAVFIGGGAIALEFGFVLARAGSSVTILQQGASVLPEADDELRTSLMAIARKTGIAIEVNATVTRIAPDRTVEAEMGRAPRPRRFPADLVVLTAGRLPNVRTLELGAAGVATEDGAVKVNAFLQSVSAPHVYVAGDAAGEPMHTSVAWYEGTLAAENALGRKRRRANLSPLPFATFTIPALGQVGLTERAARERGYRVRVSRSPMEDNAAAGIRQETEGLVKVVADAATDRVLGVHVLGAHAEDLVQIAAAAMRGGLTRAEVGAILYVFPTLGGAIFEAMAA